jgi:hypothetical protein
MKKEFLCTLLPLLALSGCGQPEPITYESLVWVNHYYIEHPVQSLSATAGGWLFRGAREYGKEIRVGFLVPGPMNKDPAKRQTVLESICPARSEVIWKTLPSNNKIVINVWTEDNKFKDTKIC